MLYIALCILQGQHMFVDSDGSQCSTVNIGIGGGTTSREYDIMVNIIALLEYLKSDYFF